MAVVTITGSDVSGGSPSGGGVGGASNLTTAGAVPYVASAGVLTQAPTGLFYDSANVRLQIGPGTPSAKLQISGDASLSAANVQIRIFDSAGATSRNWAIGNGSSTNYGSLAFHVSPSNGTNPASTSIAEFTRSGNFLLGGGTTDGGYRGDINTSGSSGTLRVYDQTATTGSTLLAVQAGAGQSGNLLSIRNNAGTEIAAVNSAGAYRSDNFVTFNTDSWNLNSGNMAFASNKIMQWSGTSNDSYAAKDLGLARNAAGVIEINNGTAGTYRDLILRRSQHSGVNVSKLPDAAAGNAGSIQYVTDANATTIGTTVAGGGANKVMVWSDGTNWKIYAS